MKAAEGWLELGNNVEANEEWEKITASVRAHPEVLKVRWKIYAAAKKWEAALDISAALMQLAPEDPAGWENASYALDEMGRPGEARDSLLRVLDRFPKNAIMRYNIAVYECKTDRLDEAKLWLDEALELADSKVLKLVDPDDPDLEPLWKDIGEL